MKRVLIIAYYWPPSGGGGVQRWLKFTRYLPEFGWQPIVYTPENANYPDIDPSLEAEVNPDVQVIRYPIWEPYALYQKFQGKKKDEQVNPGFFEDRQKQSVTKKLSIWIRGNLFIPDARKFWIKPSVKFLVNYLKEHPVDVIVSTGTPHSMHVIGQKVHQKTGIPWVADFRDPWTGIEFYDQLMLTSWADRKHRQLEKSVVQGADALTTVSWHWAEDFQKMGAKHVKVLTNGFDEANFQHEPPPKFPQFTLAHLGTFAGDRNPETLWKVLAELRNSSPDFKKDFRLLLAGKTDADIFRALDQYGLLEVTEDKGYLPHEEAIKLMQASSLLLLLINQVASNAMGRIAGKVFEYLASGTPVLCLGPPSGDASRVLKEVGAGESILPDSEAQIRQAIESAYNSWKDRLGSGLKEEITRYSRRSLTQDLSELLDQVSGKSISQLF